jgi:hypothetical protein
MRRNTPVGSTGRDSGRPGTESDCANRFAGTNTPHLPLLKTCHLFLAASAMVE